MGSPSSTIKQIEQSPANVDAIIRMAWHDRTTFETIQAKFGLTESEVICLMRRNLKRRSFDLWRKRVAARVTKHRKLFERRIKKARSVQTL